MFSNLILLQEGVGLLSNIERAGIIGTLITIIIYLVRRQQSSEKESNNEREERLKELKENAAETKALLEKVIESSNNNLKATSEIVRQHEENMVTLLRNQVERLENKINALHGIMQNKK